LDEQLQTLGAEGWELVDREDRRYIFIRKPGPIYVFRGTERLAPELMDDLFSAIGDDLALMTNGRRD
jgi:hypothetical protein